MDKSWTRWCHISGSLRRRSYRGYRPLGHLIAVHGTLRPVISRMYGLMLVHMHAVARIESLESHYGGGASGAQCTLREPPNRR